MNAQLTRTERAVYDVLAAADRPINGDGLSARARAAAYKHIRNMRAKGVPVRGCRDGFYLPARYRPPEPPSCIVVVPAQPMFRILTAMYARMEREGYEG